MISELQWIKYRLQEFTCFLRGHKWGTWIDSVYRGRKVRGCHRCEKREYREE